MASSPEHRGVVQPRPGERRSDQTPPDERRLTPPHLTPRRPEGRRPVHALLLPPGPALFEAVRLALSGDGPAVLPLSPDLPRPALRAALTTLRPTHVVTPEGVRREPAGVASDAAVIIATSGSTGAPKGVELPAEALVASARASLDRLDSHTGERWLCCLPPSHISGLQVLVRAMLNDAEPLIHPRFSPLEVTGSGAHHVSLVPTQLKRLVDMNANISTFRTILLGGAAAPPGLIDEARRRGARIVTTYGMSETSGGCVYDGVPLDNVDLEVGHDGRIRIAGPVLFSGYRLGDGFAGRWFTTSDLGAIEGGRLTVLGRVDDVINTGGQKVVAQAVADVLAGHPAVHDVVVVGRPDPEWGEIVVAVVVGDISLHELRDLAKDRLPAYAAPRAVEVVERIPLLPNGKPDLAALRSI